jgi:hypothetical protein
VTANRGVVDGRSQRGARASTTRRTLVNPIGANSTSAETRSRISAAASSAMAPPIDWPTSTQRSTPSWSRSACTHRAIASAEYAPATRSRRSSRVLSGRERSREIPTAPGAAARPESCTLNHPSREAARPPVPWQFQLRRPARVLHRRQPRAPSRWHHAPGTARQAGCGGHFPCPEPIREPRRASSIPRSAICNLQFAFCILHSHRLDWPA